VCVPNVQKYFDGLAIQRLAMGNHVTWL